MRWRTFLWVAVVGASIVRFIQSGVLWAVRSMGGDALSAIPTPFMWQLAHYWPALMKPWLDPGRPSWNYGPLVQFLTVPLMVAPTLQQASWMLLAVSYALATATFLLWVRIVQRATGQQRWVFAGMLVLWLNFFPLLDAVIKREYEVWELFLLTLALLTLRAKRPVLAGVLVGLAGSVKILPLLGIPYLFIRGEHKAGWTALLTVAVCFGAAFALWGAENSVTLGLLRDHAHGDMYPAAPANQAITNILYKMCLPLDVMLRVPVPQTPFPVLMQRIGMVLDAVIVLATLAFVRRWRHRDLLEWEMALLMIVMILIPPHANTYYVIFALPALSLAWGCLLAQSQQVGAMIKGTWLLAAVCSGLPLPMAAWGRVLGVPALTAALTLQAYSLPAFGAILAALVTVALHRVARGPDQAVMPSLVSSAVGVGA